MAARCFTRNRATSPWLVSMDARTNSTAGMTLCGWKSCRETMPIACASLRKNALPLSVLLRKDLLLRMLLGKRSQAKAQARWTKCPCVRAMWITSFLFRSLTRSAFVSCFLWRCWEHRKTRAAPPILQARLCFVGARLAARKVLPRAMLPMTLLSVRRVSQVLLRRIRPVRRTILKYS